MSLVAALAVLLRISPTIAQRPSEDKIISLPGLDFETNYNQYSGFLQLENGHNYHYWLTESQQTADTDPVVVWLNGGPGCSSLDGLLYENGPIHVYPNGTLYDHSKYAWNNNANVLYLESPICVGFSYQNNLQNCTMNDTNTAIDNYNALNKFLDKFPVYETNDWFIIGESFAGVYVPMLTRNILRGNRNTNVTKNHFINLRGFAVGNGVSVAEFIRNSRYWYLYHHGMISETVWDKMLENCCTSPYDKHSCNFNNPRNEQCVNALNDANAHCCNGVNLYNIYGSCYHYSETFSKKKYYTELKANGLWEMFALEDSDNCLDNRGSDIYLNKMDVRSAIHIPSILDDTTWSVCSDTLNYTTSFTNDMRPIYNEIFELDSSIWMTIYNGDTDGVCCFLGDEWFIDDMNLSVTHEYREWFVEDTNGKQIGGWTKDWKRGNGVHFVTVRGSGHLVPQYAPQKALKLFQYFLMNKPLD